MNTETEERILNAASRHRELLQTLTDLDYAPSALQQSKSHLKKINRQLRSLDAEVENLTDKTRKEKKEHEDLRDSMARRIAYKLTGKKEKFQSKAEKEEREYVQALEAEHRVRRNRESLLRSRKEAEDQNEDLKLIVARRDEAQKQLDELYNSVFNGPTPSFPEEDQMERNLREAQENHDSAQSRLHRDTRAAGLLQQAQGQIEKCLIKLKEAASSSQADLFGFGGGFADYVERSSLADAQTFASRAGYFLAEAITIQPRINHLGTITIAHGHILTDILFDNILIDMRFHEMIKESQNDTLNFKRNLDEELRLQRERADAVGKETEAASKTLKRARAELQRARRALFQQVMSDGVPAPVYVAEPAEPETVTETNPSTPPSPSTVPRGWRSMNPYASMIEIGEQQNETPLSDSPPRYTARVS